MQFFLFGRVASWASRVPAVTGMAPVAKEVLMQRLLALNEQDVPYSISRGNHDSELLIDWRYADAKWVDLMRVHGMNGTYRLVLRLDEGTHNVRAQALYPSFDWSAGRDHSTDRLKWNASLASPFFEYRNEAHFDPHSKTDPPSF